MMKDFTQMQVNSIKDVIGMAGERAESARAVTPSKMVETKTKARVDRIQSVQSKQKRKARVGRIQSVQFQIILI